MSFIDPEAIPYGAYYCAKCCQVRSCDVAAGHEPRDPNAPLECNTCGERIAEVIDEIQIYPYAPRRATRCTLTPEQRAAGRKLVRQLVLGTLDLPADPDASTAPDAGPAPTPEQREQLLDRLKNMRGLAT